MSRSYKKQAIVKDKNKFAQKQGNKKLRRRGKRIESEESMPKKKNEVVNQCDVTDWKIMEDVNDSDRWRRKLRGK